MLVQRWRSPVLRLLPVFLDGPHGPPAFLAAVWQDRLQLLRWRPAGTFGQWEDGMWAVFGQWEDGMWDGGRWEDGMWDGGRWEDGMWDGGRLCFEGG